MSQQRVANIGSQYFDTRTVLHVAITAIESLTFLDLASGYPPRPWKTLAGPCAIYSAYTYDSDSSRPVETLNRSAPSIVLVESDASRDPSDERSGNTSG